MSHRFVSSYVYVKYKLVGYIVHGNYLELNEHVWVITWCHVSRICRRRCAKLCTKD